jgi:C-terminal processing protease CtpA/Prc
VKNWKYTVPIISLLLSSSSALSCQEVAITPLERGLMGGMLTDIKSDVKNNYYDPQYHGVDLDARFKEASDYLKRATTYNQGIVIVAWSLKALNDSHTYLLPPRRAFKVFYGHELQVLGDDSYVVVVEPGSEAERKGLKVGERVISLNRLLLSRETIDETDYIFRVLRPQVSDELIVRDAAGAQRSQNIAPNVKSDPRELTYVLNYWDLVRESQRHRRLYRLRSHQFGDTAIVWKMPTFVMDEKAVDEMMDQSSKFPMLILDVRANGGGREATLPWLIARLSDHEVKVGDRVMRAGSQPVIAKPASSKGIAAK